MTKELKRCPFCGAEADPTGWMGEGKDGELIRGPECEGCGATGYTAEDWNRRVIDQPAPTTVVLPAERLYDMSNGASAFAANFANAAWNQCLARIRVLNPSLEFAVGDAPIVDTVSPDPASSATVDPSDSTEEPTKGAGFGYYYDGEKY